MTSFSQPKTSHDRRLTLLRNGFSLVEVVLALGLVAFVLLAITGMIPVGLKMTSDSQNESKALNLLTAIAADRRASPLSSNSFAYQLPALTNAGGGVFSHAFAVKENGQYAGQNWAESQYRVQTVIRPPATNRLDPWILSLKVTWPAGDTNTPNAVETLLALPQ